MEDGSSHLRHNLGRKESLPILFCVCRHFVGWEADYQSSWNPALFATSNDRKLVTSSLIASPKDQVVSSGSHPSPVAPVSDPVRVCCVRAKPCSRRLNDQGLLDSYGVYRSPWISCSSARHLVWKTQKSVAFLAVISYIFRGKRLRFSGFIRARSATFFGVWQDALLSPPLLRLRGVID